MQSIDELRAAIREYTWGPSELIDENTDALLALIRKVIREELMGLKELRARLGVKSSTASMRIWRGHGPPPAGRISATRFWLRPDVEEWIAENPKVVRHNVSEREAG
jgi:hypothetical protein